MNIHKHMEAIFIVTLAVVGVGSFALDSAPQADAMPAAPLACKTATPNASALVVVRAAKAARRA